MAHTYTSTQIAKATLQAFAHAKLYCGRYSAMVFA